MKKTSLFLLSIALLTSCGGNIGEGVKKLGSDIKKTMNVMRNSMGAPYEVLLVCDNEIWNSSAGQALEQALDTPVPGLPQQEATFKVARTSHDGFNTSKQAYRNIIVVEIDESHSECEFRFEKDVFASPQIVMGIYAPDKKSFGKFVNDNSQVIVDFFTEKEREQQISELESKYNKNAMELIQEKFGCEMKIPTSISGYKRGENFLWISDYNNPSKMEIMSFAIYSYPYTSTDNFSKEFFIQMRDSFMMKNIQGAEEGQFIQTDAKTVQLEEVAYRGKYMSIARGMWYMKNDDMFGGGPFVSHSIVDEKNGRVIVAEAFVYAPNKEKRGYMRKLEASLYTLKLPADIEKEKKATNEKK